MHLARLAQHRDSSWMSGSLQPQLWGRPSAGKGALDHLLVAIVGCGGDLDAFAPTDDDCVHKAVPFAPKQRDSGCISRANPSLGEASLLMIRTVSLPSSWERRLLEPFE